MSPKIAQLLALIVIVLACWLGFRWHYIGVGKQQCRDAQAQANKAQVERERKREAESDDIGRAAEAAADTTVREALKQSDEAAERIRVVYKDRWLTPTPGMCSVPLQPEVQEEINAAVRRSNGESP